MALLAVVFRLEILLWLLLLSLGPFLVSMFSLGLQSCTKLNCGTSPIRAGDDGQIAAQTDARVGEGRERLLAVDDADAVVDIEANLKSSADGVQLNARGRTPGAVWKTCNQDSRPCGTRHLETGAERGEDGKANSFGDDLWRNSDDDAILGLLLRRINDSVSRFNCIGVGRGGHRSGRRVGVDSLFAEGLENGRGLVALLVQRLGEEALAAQLVRNAVDGRRGLHAQSRETLAPAKLVMPVLLASCMMLRGRRRLLVRLLLLMLLLAFHGRLMMRRGTRRFIEGVRGRRRKDGIRRVVCGNRVV